MFYNEACILALHRRQTKGLIIGIIALTLAASFIVPTAFFIDDSSILWITICDCLLLSIAGTTFTYCILNLIMPASRKKKFIRKLQGSRQKEVGFEEISVGKIETIDHELQAFCIEAKEGKAIHHLRLDTEFKTKIGEIQAAKKVITINGFIVEVLSK